MWRLADHLIDEFVADERCEFASANGQPFPLLVIADLLGVPETDHSMFRELLAGKGPAEDGRVNMNPLAYLDKWFTAYISDRRDTPTRDMLTEMATQRFADGSLPEVVDVVRIATFLFIAGHETTARLLSSALRGNRDRIPNFVEEMLRLESPIKSDFRLTRVATTLGGVERPAKCAPERGVRPRGAQLPRGHLPESRVESPSSGSWTGSKTFGSTKPSTDRRGIVVSTTCCAISFGAWKPCTSSSPQRHDHG
jgi:hypothetical protein